MSSGNAYLNKLYRSYLFLTRPRDLLSPTCRAHLYVRQHRTKKKKNESSYPKINNNIQSVRNKWRVWEGRRISDRVHASEMARRQDYFCFPFSRTHPSHQQYNSDYRFICSRHWRRVAKSSLQNPADALWTLKPIPKTGSEKQPSTAYDGSSIDKDRRRVTDRKKKGLGMSRFVRNKVILVLCANIKVTSEFLRRPWQTAKVVDF